VIALLRGSMLGALLTRPGSERCSIFHIELLVPLCPRKFVSEDAATKRGTNREPLCAEQPMVTV
jgi:hypothetical protein